MEGIDNINNILNDMIKDMLDGFDVPPTIPKDMVNNMNDMIIKIYKMGFRDAVKMDAELKKEMFEEIIIDR